ncbi:cation:proton antiporter [Pulveribacter suum]|uniref:Sodium:proton antiporter n=1 Tax=Pulveribacter suum TaxID=2116657 RepID=A0A2P1NH42_9BURK|nr:sodium:proton antiporter [Pulveribacter suum]AVP56364.1 sodium:proton antiporter [Pulveribacter suum]
MPWLSSLLSHPAPALALLLAIGFLAQWLAWRVRVPAILPLLLLGLLLGPFTGLVDPDALLGELLFPAVSLSVAVILFEGSLGLRFAELDGIGHAVRRLSTYGALVALVGLAAAAHWLAGLSWPLSFLFGAITCVTGPTVVNPMLRVVRPNARLASLLRWEGIVIDPLGALLAVLVYEVIAAKQFPGEPLWVFALTLAGGTLIGLLAAWLLALALRRHFIPEYLQGYAALALMLATFTLSNALTRESGLLAVTAMGIALGNLRGIHIEPITRFKENLSILLVSLLFLILAARLSWPLPPGMLLGGLLVYLAAQFVVRPLSVWLSTLGSPLSVRERLLAAWISPRGIVAASISALFALQLQDSGVHGADRLVPLVFLLIIATVVVQSLTARQLARWLGVREPDPRGVLVFGADPVARALAQALHGQGVQVLVADDDWAGIRAARMAGLPTYFGNPTSRHASHHLDLTGLGRLLALSTQYERNALAAVHFRREFGRDRVLALRTVAREEGSERQRLAEPLMAPALFGEDMTHARLQELLDAGWKLKTTTLSDQYDWAQFQQAWGGRALALFVLTDKGQLRIAGDPAHTGPPAPGQTVTALVPPAAPAVPLQAGS